MVTSYSGHSVRSSMPYQTIGLLVEKLLWVSNIFIFPTWFKQFHLHFANFLLTGSMSSYYKISSFLPWSNKLYIGECNKFICNAFCLLMSVLYIQTSQPYKSDGISKTVYTFNWDCLWAKLRYSSCAPLWH